MDSDAETLAEYYRDPVGHCIRALDNLDPIVRFNAADILRGLARDAEPALPALTAHFTDPDYDVRAQCVFAVSNIVTCLKSPPENVLAALQVCLLSAEAEMAHLAATGIAAYGARAHVALPALEQARQIHGESEVRELSQILEKIREALAVAEGESAGSAPLQVGPDEHKHKRDRKDSLVVDDPQERERD